MEKVSVIFLVLAIFVTGLAFAKHGGRVKSHEYRTDDGRFPPFQLCKSFPDSGPEVEEASNCPAVTSRYDL